MVPEFCMAPETMLNQNCVMRFPGVGKVIEYVVGALAVRVQDIGSARGVSF